jgi:hypothetical protein
VEPEPRSALLIGVGDYGKATGYSSLRSPHHDVEALAEVLRDPAVGAFTEVSVETDPDEVRLRRRVGDFVRDRKPSELVLVYFSGHGDRDGEGDFYLVAADSDRGDLHATATQDSWLTETLERCRAGRQILVLDCCFAGALTKGEAVLTETLVRPTSGRAVLAAARADKAARDGAIGDDGSVRPSLYTEGLVGGLRTGEADLDGDGVITVEEAHLYARDHVRRASGEQDPQWQFSGGGAIRLATSVRGPLRTPTPVAVIPADASLLPSLEPPWGKRSPTGTIGRDEVIGKVTAGWPSEGATGKAVVLHGVQGIGKTSIALEVCERGRGRGADTWWVSGEDRATFEKGMYAVAYRAGATRSEFDTENAADVAWRALAERERPWVLVVDNVNEVSVIDGLGDLAARRGWLRRPDGRGLLVVTSRTGARTMWRWLTPVRVDPLDSDSAAEILTTLAPAAGDRSDAVDLAQSLGRHPGLLHLAGSTLAANGRIHPEWSDTALLRLFSDYIRELSTRDERPTRSTNAETLRPAVWSISVEQVRRLASPTALRLFLLVCCMEFPLPYVRVLNPHRLRRSGLFDDITPYTVMEAVDALEALDLVRRTAMPVSAAGREVEDVLTVSSFISQETRAHPLLAGHAGAPYRRAAIWTVLDSVATRVGDIAGPLAWGPRTNGHVDQLLLATLEKMIDRWKDLYEEWIDIHVTVGDDDDGDFVREVRRTRPLPGLVCRSFRPIVSTDTQAVADMRVTLADDGTEADAYSFLDLGRKPTLVVLFPPGDMEGTGEEIEWTAEYRVPGLWSPLRTDGSDWLYYNMVTSRGRREEATRHLSLTIRFPAGRNGSVTEVSDQGETLPRTPDGRFAWRSIGQGGDRYWWRLEMPPA